jgi:prephenate dehydrogenase
MNNLPKSVAIIGVGLIGGSFAMGIRRTLGKNVTITGLCKEHAHTRAAIESGFIERPLTLTKSALSAVDLILIATPVMETIVLLKKISPLVSSKTLIIDVASTKDLIVKSANHMKAKFTFVGTHPMAGSQLSGAHNASPFLFQSKPWILTPTKKSSQSDIERGKQIIRLLGGIPVVLPAPAHDKLVAFASHLPSVTANLLFQTAASQQNWKDIAALASTGFRDTTRLSSQNSHMKNDFILSNRENIIFALTELRKNTDTMIAMLQNPNTHELLTMLSNTKKMRDRWLTQSLRESL